MNRKNLKPVVKYVLFILLGVAIGITIYQLFTLETTTQTPAGEYTCRGGIIQICSGEQEVKDYLGV